MPLTRRAFVRGGALALVGTSAVPAFLVRTVMAQARAAAPRSRRLVVVFQRGAADGLNIVIPHAEPSYFAMRPSIAVPREQVIDLDSFFGLHPATVSLKPLWDQRHLAIVHAAGSLDMTRSHFDAQDYMESGTPGVKSTADGWLNRALQAEDRTAKRGQSPFRAIALSAQMPRTLEGRVPAIALNNLRDFHVGAGRNASNAEASFAAIYGDTADAALRGAGRETFEAEKMLAATRPEQYTPLAGAAYPKGNFGDSMRQIAQLLKADLGVEAAFADIGGWDHHQNEGSVNGQLADRLREFSQSLAAFWIDLGALAEDTVVVTMSEFGRTARENGTRGTDHGHANVMFVLGGPVRGGRVYGRWPGLAPEQLNEGRDLAVTTDFRQVLAEAAYRQINARDLELTFPGAQLRPDRFLRLLG